ncbi:LysR family transcriptional regulator [Cohaesibacter marisflavi]|nr:LysR family transcriptional regulator [Cohaesibacter marisflavi]
MHILTLKGVSGVMDWENIRYFRAVIETGSVAAAARDLGVERTTVTRRIQALERETGLELFDRRGRRLVLTAAGQDYAHVTGRMSDAAQEAALCAEGIRPGMSGRIKISAPPSLAKARLIAPLLAFGFKHPKLEIELIGEIGFASLHRGEADIAVRLSRPEEGDLAISKMSPIAFHLYGHRDYVANTPEDKRRYIGQSDETVATPQHVALKQIAGGKFAIYLDDIDLQLAAVLAKGGIAALPDFLVEHQDDLVPLGAKTPLVEREVWSVTHNAQRHQERIKETINVIRQALH